MYSSIDINIQFHYCSNGHYNMNCKGDGGSFLNNGCFQKPVGNDFSFKYFNILNKRKLTLTSLQLIEYSV